MSSHGDDTSSEECGSRNGSSDRSESDEPSKKINSVADGKKKLERDSFSPEKCDGVASKKDRSRSRDGKRSASREKNKSHGKRSRSRSHHKDHRRRSRSKDRRSKRSHSRNRSGRVKSQRKYRSKSRSVSASRNRSKRSRSSSRDKHRRNRDRRSRSKGRRSRSKDRGRRSRSRNRRSRSRDDYRGRTPPKIRRRRKFLKHLNPEQVDMMNARGILIQEASSGLSVSSSTVNVSTSQLQRPIVATPQLAVQQTMAAMSAQAEALTGIALPKYYNPAAVNPLRYAEQMQKRKLLWQNKSANNEKTSTDSTPSATSTKTWNNLSFSQDEDGKVAAKFRKLMGIKSETDSKSGSDADGNTETKQKQDELFKTLDQQYEIARMSTHTHRGVGLGFSSQAVLQPPASTNPR